MNVTAVTDSINKKQMNGAVKRSYSTMTPTHTSLKYEGTKDGALRPTAMPALDARDYFSHERAFANVKIVFPQQTIWCDKASLAAASPVMRDSFLKTNNDDEVLTFDEDDDLDEFLAMLEFIYPLFNPEINDGNITALIRLAHRFQFDVLRQACQCYARTYLGTIRHVNGRCHSAATSHGDDSMAWMNENECQREHDLIEFRNGTCAYAFPVLSNLCQWLKTYFYNDDDRSLAQLIVNVLRQISADGLEHVLTSSSMNDEIQAFVYKARAEYLENAPRMKRVA